MPQSPAKQFSKIFVCYRREDSSGHARLLSGKLSDHFGADNVFMDIDHIGPGQDFVQAIEEAVASCEILIAVIGRHWLLGIDQKGPSLLERPNDFVRIEIAAALNRNIPVIPILVQGASMPSPDQIPGTLSKLSRLNALALSDDRRWKGEVDQLILSMDKTLAQREQARRLAEQKEEERRLREADRLLQESLRLAEVAEEAARLEAERQKREAEEKEVRRLSEEALFGNRSVQVGLGRAWSPGSKRALIIGAVISLMVVVASIGVWLRPRTDPAGQGSTTSANVSASPDASDRPASTATQPTNTESPFASQTNTVSTNAGNANKSVESRPSNVSGRATKRKQESGAAQRQRCALAALNNQACP